MDTQTNGKFPVAIGSTVFYGFRFNIAEADEFDYEDYLSNKEDAEQLYGCKVIVIDVRIGEYAVVFSDCHSFQINCAPQNLVSRKFTVRRITDEDREKMERYCEYFKIPYQKPGWRHATTCVLLPEEYEKEAIKKLNELEYNF